MSRLFETASSAFAAASLLGFALGCVIVSNPSWADEPLGGGGANCAQDCGNLSTCGDPCYGNCVNSDRDPCDCDCDETGEPNSDCANGFAYDCVYAY